MKVQIDIGYENKPLYKNIDIPLNTNGMISIVGDNGSGKSTLYKTLLGIIPPLTGHVPESIIQQIAVISDYVSLPEEVTVSDILDLLGREKVAYAKNSYLDFHLYIMQYKKQRIKTLSSGQRRIIEIYTVLASGKKIVVLDEASNSLDFTNRELFLSHVKKLSTSNILFFHTSHELYDVVYLEGVIYGLFKDEQRIKQFHDTLSVDNLHKFLGYGVRA